jgi:hypothetical protein
MSRRRRDARPRTSRPALLAAYPHLLATVEAHYRRAVAGRTTAAPVVVVEVLDRPAERLDEAMVQVDSEDRRGLPIAVGVQSRAWVARRLRPCSARAAESVRRGGASAARPLTLVIVSGAGIEVMDLSCAVLA